MNLFLARLYCIVALIIFPCADVRAEGGCPPGQYPQQGPGWRACVPIPGAGGAGVAAPPVEWGTRWGATAVDQGHKLAGAATGKKTETEAVDAAIADCKAYGGEGCMIGTVYKNQCVAVISGDRSGKSYLDRIEANAINRGIDECNREGQKDCHVFYSGCSQPERLN